MKVIHISRARYDQIRSQGWQLPADKAMATYPEGDTEYHLLDGERALCESCGSIFDSIVANDPAELEMAKRAA